MDGSGRDGKWMDGWEMNEWMRDGWMGDGEMLLECFRKPPKRLACTEESHEGHCPRVFSE